MDDVVIRLANAADAEAIRRIYNHEVEHTTHTFDLVSRSLEDQQAWLRDREGALGVVVAEVGGEVAGFASLSEYRPRAAYRTSVESSVYVDESARGQGLGQRLMRELVRVAEARGFHTMIARIAGGHEASIRLHQAVGFATVGTEREVGRKFGGWLDVAVMQRMLDHRQQDHRQQDHRQQDHRQQDHRQQDHRQQDHRQQAERSG